MNADEESDDSDKWQDAADPYTIAAIGAELERIVGEDRPSESVPPGP